jgi:hypothetical protein
MHAEFLALHVSLDEAQGGSADDDRIQSCQALEARRQVGRLSQGQLFVSHATTHLSHDHLTRMDAKTDSQSDTSHLLQARIQHAHRLDNFQSSVHGAQGVVFVGLGIAEIDQETIPKVLGNVPIKALHYLSARLLVGAYHLTQVFRVEPAGQGRGIRQIAEHHRQLPTLSRERLDLWSVSVRHRRRRRNRNGLGQ